jgi:hypothetical protein
MAILRPNLSLEEKRESLGEKPIKLSKALTSWGQCYDFEKSFARKKNDEKMVLLTRKAASLSKSES